MPSVPVGEDLERLIRGALAFGEIQVDESGRSALLPHLETAQAAARTLGDEAAGSEPEAAFDARWEPRATEVPATVTELAADVGARRISPLEAVEAALARIAEVDRHLEAYVTVCGDRALEEAASMTAAGPLAGVPVAVKDIVDVAGLPTLCGSRVRAGHVAESDATVVRRLREAGAIVIGKTTTHEFAYGPVCAPTRNAWDQRHMSGGSSGGSAVAVAQGMAAAAIGTDTGGSVRCPAAYNGIVGLKPTFGRISKAGVVPLSWSLDHVGLMARTVDDVATLLAAVAGWDEADTTSSRAPVGRAAPHGTERLDGLRIGVAAHYYHDPIAADVLDAFEAGLDHLCSLGATRVDVVIEDVDLSPATQLGILLPEASAYHERTLRSSAELYGDDVRTFLELGEVMPATYYVNSLRTRARVKAGFRRCFSQHRLDLLATPTLPITAPRVGQSTVTFAGGREESVMTPLLVACAPANLTGQPVLTVPCGRDGAGLPIGLSLVGRPFDEHTVLRAGAAYERSTPWAAERPPQPRARAGTA